MNYRLLIFDLDGTLVDSQTDLWSAVNRVRSDFGMPAIDLKTLRSFIGDGVVSLMERAIPDASPRELERALKKFRQHYRRHLLDTTSLYPGVRKTLDRYSDRKKAVLTNKSEIFSVEILEKLGVLEQFVMVWGGDSGSRKKPDPEPVLGILERLKMQKNDAVMIGDGPNDILAAKNAGIASIAVTYGYTAKEELSLLSPDYCIDSLEELSRIIS